MHTYANTMFSQALEENKNDKITHTFLLTINSNKAARTQEDAERYKNHMMNHFRSMFGDFEQFVQIYKSGHYVHRKPAKKSFGDIAENVRVNPQFEIGGELHRIHAHIVLKWDSSPQYFFQINMQLLRNWLRSNVGDVYANVRWIKGDSELFRYINKATRK